MIALGALHKLKLFRTVLVSAMYPPPMPYRCNIGGWCVHNILDIYNLHEMRILCLKCNIPALF